MSLLEWLWLAALTATVLFLLWNQWRHWKAERDFDQMIEDSKTIEEAYRRRF